ncbi:TetR/AcrR family transcriptional regulator [Actinomadura physcomitrii]|uniref:TetR/AcrR family transcriptional regulator n=1 Tax=Actinomadura physcomitrii TaxID=2650748 RepID=UPI001921C401|nr:helix-turn-helix domain-containing protein [Actinomadura physcomitrii]
MPAADTRTRLIEVAERLFAERGVNAVSLREIAAAAGQRNTSAVACHFGTKEKLVTAIYRHRLAPTNELQLRRLAELDPPAAAPRPPARGRAAPRPGSAPCRSAAGASRRTRSG